MIIPFTKAVRFFPFFLVVYEFAVNSSNDMYLPALLDLADEFQVGDTQIQWTLSAWLAGAAFVQLLLGPLSDWIGRRFVLLSGGFFFLLATLGCFFVKSIGLFILFRFIQGVGMCTLTAAGYAAIHEYYAEKKAVEILAWVAAVSMLAPMLGPFMGGILLIGFGWRMIFLTIFIIALVAWLGLVFSMPETNLNPDPEAMNLKKLVRSYSRIVKNPLFFYGVLSDGFLYGCVMAWITASPFLLLEHYDLTRFQFGLVQIPIFLAYALGAIWIKKLSHRFNLERVISLGLGISAVGACLLWVLSFSAGDVLHFGVRMILPLAILSFGFGLASAPLTRKILFSTKETLGISTAMLDLGIVGMGACGSFLVSLFYDHTLFPVASILALFSVFSLAMNSRRVYLQKKIKL